MTGSGVDNELGERRGYFLLVTPELRQPEGLQLRSVAGSLWHSRWTILAVGVVAAGLALVFSLVRAPVYRAETVLTVRSGQLSNALGATAAQMSGLASIVGLGLGGVESKRNEYLALLKSRALAREFIETRNVIPVLYQDRWDADVKAVSPDWRGRVPTLGDVVDAFEEIRSIREDGRTGIVTVTFESGDPEVAAEWANSYVEAANEMLRAEAAKRAGTAVDYLNDALGKTTVEPVRQGLYRLLESRLNESMVAAVEPEYAFKVIERAEVPEKHRFVRPRRVPEVLLGGFFGLVVGGAIAVFRGTRVRPG